MMANMSDHGVTTPVRVQIAAQYGRHLIGRDIGFEIRKRFAGPPDTWPAALDFSGVAQATESCMDELLGTLARDHGIEALQRIEIMGASKPVKETIAYILAIVSKPPAPMTADSVRRILKDRRSRAGRTPKKPKKR